jgi:hypothetical protein
MKRTQTFPPNNNSLKGTLQHIPLADSKDRHAYELLALPMGPALFFFVSFSAHMATEHSDSRAPRDNMF